MSFQSLISGAAWALCRLLPVKNNKKPLTSYGERLIRFMPYSD